MNTFALDIFEEHLKCTFYTVRWIKEDKQEKSETEKFFRKFNAQPEYEQCVKEIIALLDYIGDDRGANRYLFRPEGKADALPKNEKKLVKDLCFDFADFKLRLYCLRITDEILILFNGGIKNAVTAQQSDASMVFYEAQEFCKRINQAFSDKEIKIEGNKIISIYQENIEL